LNSFGNFLLPCGGSEFSRCLFYLPVDFDFLQGFLFVRLPAILFPLAAFLLLEISLCGSLSFSPQILIISKLQTNLSALFAML
jgi:hypothetical protein